MKIKRIKVNNFRGFYKEKTFEFEEAPFILLSAPNGIGKTTLIDAIEWAFTGSIGRLKDAFDARSSNANDRKKNTFGILKNKYSKKDEEVSVELTIVDADKEYTVKRTQQNDVIDSDKSHVEYSSPDFERIANEYCKENAFYAYHFCDINKSINLQAKKSEDIVELFSEFIRNYDREKSFASNLEIYSDDVQRKIDDDNDQILTITKEIVKNEELLNNSKAQITPYPKYKVFEDEEIDISKFGVELLDLQLSKLYMCAKIKASGLLEKEQRNIDTLKNIKTLEKTKQIYKEKQPFIYKSYEYGGNITVKKRLEESKDYIKKYTEILNKVSTDNLSGYAVEILKLNEVLFTKEYYKQVTELIEKKNTYVSDMKKEVDNLVKGNSIIDLMTSLISKENELLNYKNNYKTSVDNLKCPICGSDKFGSVVDSEILKEAKIIVGINREIISKKKSEIEAINAEVKKQKDELLNNAKTAIEVHLEKFSLNTKELENINNETKGFYDEIKKLKNMNIPEKITDEYSLEEKIIELNSLILVPEEINIIKREYTDLLMITDFRFEENERIESIIKRLKTELDPEIKIAEKVEKEDLILKVNSIKSVKANHKYVDLVEKNNKYKEKLKEINEEVEYLTQLKTKSDKQAERIRQIVSELERNEFNSIGPTLRKIYKKLIRIDNISNIELKYEGKKLLILDENKKNIVNILSNGQLSVFMLAYFFAGIYSRDDELIKVYFIDDLTACMDDINMLSFLDLIKYQMKDDNGYIEQLFFASCDEKICKLLKYKLDGCGIKWHEINENDFC